MTNPWDAVEAARQVRADASKVIRRRVAGFMREMRKKHPADLREVRVVLEGVCEDLGRELRQVEVELEARAAVAPRPGANGHGKAPMRPVAPFSVVRAVIPARNGSGGKP